MEQWQAGVLSKGDTGGTIFKEMGANPPVVSATLGPRNGYTSTERMGE